MKTNSFLIFLLLTMIHWPGFSQNLVPNPSFEECHEILTNWALNDAVFESAIKHWNTPNQGSPDLLFSKALERIRIRPKINLPLYQARTGYTMLGMTMYGCKNALHCKEYVQVKLTEPMKIGHRYVVEYWVNPLKAAIKVNGIGWALSEKEVDDPKRLDLYNISPNFEENNIIDDTDPNSWTRITDTICAEQNYEFMIIGMFRRDSTISIVQEPNGLDYAYYLFDDVKIEELQSHCEDKPIEEVINCRNIQFELNSAQLSQPSFLELDKLSHYLSAQPNINITIEGHTDNIGSAAANQLLSEARVQSVVEYLVKKGIESNRLAAKGYGELKPIADNSTENGRWLNRRVEIKKAEFLPK